MSALCSYMCLKDGILMMTKSVSSSCSIDNKLLIYINTVLLWWLCLALKEIIGHSRNSAPEWVILLQ